MFIRSRILNGLAFGCSLAALLCPWFRACDKSSGSCSSLALLRVGSGTAYTAPALSALLVPGLAAALLDVIFCRWYKRAGLVLHQCYLIAAVAAAVLLCTVGRVVAERSLPHGVELRLQSVGFFLALLGQVLLLMSACCAIAGGSDDGRYCLWPSPRSRLPMTMKANNFAFEFDSVLGDLERMDSIASFPSEAKSQSMVGGRSQINIHVDCRGGPHASPPSSASSIPLQFSPEVTRRGGLPLAPDVPPECDAPSHASHMRAWNSDREARTMPSSLSPSLVPSSRAPALLTAAELRASRPVSLRGLYSAAQSGGPAATQGPGTAGRMDIPEQRGA